MTSKTIGQRLADWRAARRLTQEELAEAAGVHVVTISKWERGEQEPRYRKLVKIAEKYGVPVETITGDTGNGVSRDTPPEAVPDRYSELAREFDRLYGEELDPWHRTWRIAELAAAYRAAALRKEADAAEERARAAGAAERAAEARARVAQPVPLDQVKPDPRQGQRRKRAG